MMKCDGKKMNSLSKKPAQKTVRWAPPASGSEIFRGIYGRSDFIHLQGASRPSGDFDVCLRSFEELLERDRQREKDGFPRKIKIGRLVRPGHKNKVSVVPTTVEEKFIHDNVTAKEYEEGESGGAGDGEEGEVIGERPIDESGGPGAGGAG